MNELQFEFVMAVELYKKLNRRLYPTFTEILEVMRQLGYRKVLSAGQIQDDDWHVMMSGQPLSYERTRMYGGELKTLSTTKVPYLSEDGKTLGIIGISRDISELKRTELQLRESRTELREYLDSMSSFNAKLALDIY